MTDPPQPQPPIAGLSQKSMSRILLVVALLSGCGLMFPLLSAGPLVLDEHGSYWITGAENPGRLLDRSLNYAALPPLSAWLQRAFLVVAGESELTFRASSAICYLLAIGFTYLLGRDFLGPIAGGLAALLVAWHPSVVDEVRFARCYGLVLMLAVLALWATVRWRRQPEKMRWAVAWGVVNAGLLWTHYVTAAYVGLQGLVLVGPVLLTRRKKGPAVRSLAVAVLVLLVLVLRLLPAIERMWQWREFLNFAKNEPPIWQIIGPLWWLGLPLGWLVAGVLSWRGSPANRITVPLKENFWPLFILGLVPLLLVVLASRGDLTTLANPRYRIAFAVPGACLLAVCLTHRKTIVAACVGAIITITAAWSMTDSAPWQLGRLGSPRADQWLAMAQKVEREGRAGEPVFVQSGLIESQLVASLYKDELFMDYMSCRLGRFYLKTPHRRYGLPFVWNGFPEVERFYLGVLDDVCSSRQPTLWVACATDTDLNRRSLRGLQRLLTKRNFREIDIDTVHSNDAVLIHYECKQQPEQIR